MHRGALAGLLEYEFYRNCVGIIYAQVHMAASCSRPAAVDHLQLSSLGFEHRDLQVIVAIGSKEFAQVN